MVGSDLAPAADALKAIDPDVTVVVTHSLFPLPLQANRPPAKLNLLTCQVKHNPEEKRSFDLISRELWLIFSALSTST